MRARGITYDTGFVLHGVLGRPGLTAATIERELRVIRDELHCTAVRLIGGDADRLELAASYAADLGLEIWFSPYPLELTADEMLELFTDCAARAERIRRGGAEVVFVAGAELSLMGKGFLPGDDIAERVALLMRDRRQVAEAGARVREFLDRAVPVVRQHFGGPVTYASVQLEQVDWAPFDIVSVDLYRTAAIAGQFAEGVRALVGGADKPVAVTEFGSASYRGAGDRGAQALDVVEHDPATRAPLRLTGEYERDEQGQAAELRDYLQIFDAAGVDSAFVFIFALYDYPHRPGGDPRDDLDLASYGIVKVLDGPGRPWEPKAAFAAVADHYRAA